MAPRKPNEPAQSGKRPTRASDIVSAVEVPVEWTVQFRERAPLPPPGDFTMTVKFQMTTSGFDEAAARLKKLIEANDVVVKLFERAVLQSIVVNVRKRFLANATKALEMKVLEQNGLKVQVSPRERMNDIDMQNRLSQAMADLNEAQFEGKDEDTIASLRERTLKLGERLRNRMGQDPKGRPIGHRLSQIAGNNFRRMMLRMLALIVDAQFVRGERSGGSITVGVGPTYWLDQLETPSATMALTGLPTRSKYKSFWRHLEFGTGARRSAAKDKLNPGVRPPSTWWYGKRQKNSLLLEGTAPMNFLTDAGGQLYPEDMTALAKALTKALDDLLSVKA